ncbi:serine hydrolase [Corynebacterium terpenotabidum]|uniref:Uncharacterized protein n=1 Tax=Corynebacterium terpenotabidum Y-11 TaxID=1200352 RepID=S4XGY5_9CORY|nr:hypothetical protein [Corynebacterium terpenotabidum]AGP31806.1 hypothetical protein A606_10835 [Corynebacterium terpenotabidum Y-11]
MESRHSRGRGRARDGAEQAAEQFEVYDDFSSSSSSGRVGLWVLGTLLLAILSITVLVTALQDVDSDAGDVDEERAALESAAIEASRPTEQEQANAATTRLTEVITDIEERYDVVIGVSSRAGGGVIHAGDLDDVRAWSSVKVPIALAAVQNALKEGTTADLADDITLALTQSDNDAALRLWETLGTDEESSTAVDTVLRQAGDPTDAESDRSNDDYEGFGDIHWSLDNQIIFANRLGCLAGADQVLDAMGQVIPEYRRGLGLLPNARFKGGWGTEPDGTYLLREFGLVGEEGRQVPLAIAVEPADGTDTTARAAAGALAEALAPVITELADADGTAQCQVPAGVSAASDAAPADAVDEGDTVDGDDTVDGA